MKKTYKMIDLDCANCAAKMEEAIKKIDGVTSASVSFMTQKMTIEGDDARFDQIVKEAVQGVQKSRTRLRDCTEINVRRPKAAMSISL